MGNWGCMGFVANVAKPNWIALLQLTIIMVWYTVSRFVWSSRYVRKYFTAFTLFYIICNYAWIRLTLKATSYGLSKYLYKQRNHNLQTSKTPLERQMQVIRYMFN